MSEYLTLGIRRAFAVQQYGLAKRRGLVQKGETPSAWADRFMKGLDDSVLTQGEAIVLMHDTAMLTGYFPIVNIGRNFKQAYYDDTGQEAPEWVFTVAVFDETQTMLGRWDPRTAKTLTDALFKAVDRMAAARPGRLRLPEE